MTEKLTTVTSTSPLPTVDATAVPKVNAATKLKNAAQMTALPGREHTGGDHGRDRVRGVVESVDVVEDEGDDDQRRHREQVRIHRSIRRA